MRAENKLESHCRRIIQKMAVMQRSWMQSAVKPQWRRRTNQRRFGYTRSLKYHLVVMLGARINIIQPQIRNLIAYLLPLPDKKLTTAVIKRDKTSGLDRNDRQKCSCLQRTLLIRKGSSSLVVLRIWRFLASHDYIVNEIMFLCMCKTTNWRFIIICNCIYIVVINRGWRMDGTVGGARCTGCRMSSSDVTFLRKSLGLVNKHSYFMLSVCILLWTDCF